jgi:hypothetical protein
VLSKAEKIFSKGGGAAVFCPPKLKKKTAFFLKMIINLKTRRRKTITEMRVFEVMGEW